ncbi:MAG: hypothetical protein Q4C16_05215, partial [Eubacteriales bacterium]|nr:hypothetical protein [Eubacteriales bacterium]
FLFAEAALAGGKAARAKNNADASFFALGGLCRKASQTSSDRIRETASADFSSRKPPWRAARRQEQKTKLMHHLFIPHGGKSE